MDNPGVSEQEGTALTRAYLKGNSHRDSVIINLTLGTEHYLNRCSCPNTEKFMQRLPSVRLCASVTVEPEPLAEYSSAIQAIKSQGGEFPCSVVAIDPYSGRVKLSSPHVRRPFEISLPEFVSLIGNKAADVYIDVNPEIEVTTW